MLINININININISSRYQNVTERVSYLSIKGNPLHTPEITGLPSWFARPKHTFGGVILINGFVRPLLFRRFKNTKTWVRKPPELVQER